MADQKELEKTVSELRAEVRDLSGMMLATGIILTQMLQTMTSRELNPHGSLDKLVENARDGIASFTKQTGADPAVTERALSAVKQYEDQIRSVLRI